MIVALTSAGGSPGVTTTALALATAWPRRVVVLEADPVGASPVLAGYFRGQLTHDRGLPALVLAAGAGSLPAALREVPVPLPGVPRAAVVAGLAAPEQAEAVARLWPDLLVALRALDPGTDVLVDAGRLGHRHEPTALLRAADIVALVLRPTLPGVAVARARLRSPGSPLPAGPGRLGLVVVGHRPYPPEEVGRAIDTAVLGALPWEPAHAAVYSDGRPRPRGRRRPLDDAARRLARRLRASEREAGPARLVTGRQAGAVRPAVGVPS